LQRLSANKEKIIGYLVTSVCLNRVCNLVWKENNRKH